ncbi:MAG: hypothetical protein WC686_00225 [Candidatus Shapirobacteria bacterium]|jgi:Tfp pilus assembly protein PilX
MAQPGYIALSSILMISVIIVLISITQALTSVNESQFSLVHTQSDRALNMAESCVEDVLIKLNKDNAIPPTIYLPSGICAVNPIVNTGTGWTFTVTATQASITKSLTVQATRNSAVTLTGWQEN